MARAGFAPRGGRRGGVPLAPEGRAASPAAAGSGGFWEPRCLPAGGRTSEQVKQSSEHLQVLRYPSSPLLFAGSGGEEVAAASAEPRRPQPRSPAAAPERVHSVFELVCGECCSGSS